MNEAEAAAYNARVATFNFSAGGPSYVVSFSRAELYVRLSDLGFFVSGSTEILPHFNAHSAYLSHRERRDLETLPHRAWLLSCGVEIEATPTGTRIAPTRIEIRRGPEEATREEAMKLFRREVIEPISGTTAPEGFVPRS